MVRRLTATAMVFGLGLVMAGCGGGGGSTDTTPGRISGRVVDAQGNPVEGATVSAAGLTAITDQNGDYTIENVPPGTYLVSVTASGEVFSDQSATVGADQTSTVNFQPAPNRPPTASLTVTPDTLNFVGGAVQITATVSDPDGDTPLTVTGSFSSSGSAGASFDPVETSPGTYQTIVNVPGNGTTAPVTYTFTVTVSDGAAASQASDSVTVNGVTAPGGGTEPPTPEI